MQSNLAASPLRNIRRFCLALNFLLAPLTALSAEHGFAIHSDLRLGADFAHFPYANPEAAQGGLLRQGTVVTFDTTNGMRFPGKMPNEFDYIYDTLMVRAEDELASYYGLIAESVALADDFSSAVFTLRSNARWHDGTPLTAEDVRFTFETVRAHGLPRYRTTLQPIEIEVLSPHKIRFSSAIPGDWVYLDLIATFPIYPKHVWAERDVSKMSMQMPLGSGPYRVSALDLNDRTLIERVPDYWGNDLPVNKGLWNFDRIETVYFADRTVMIEALRAGRLDINRELNGAFWADSYDGPALESGQLEQSTFTMPGGGWSSGLIFNLRRPPLEDRRVREALTIAFDGPWIRANLYRNAYPAPGRFYGQSALSAGAAVTPEEIALLSPFKVQLPSGLFDAPAPEAFDALTKRQRLRRADALLTEAGYVLANGIRVNRETGTPLQLEYVGAHADIRPVITVYAKALSELGIELEIEIHDYVVGRRFILDHDFDLTLAGFGSDFPPGASERLFWHSENALKSGYALAGAQDPAIDAAIEAMTGSTDFEEIIGATRTFDRVLSWQRYILPMWRRDKIWIAHDANLRFPAEFQFKNFHHVQYL